MHQKGKIVKSKLTALFILQEVLKGCLPLSLNTSGDNTFKNQERERLWFLLSNAFGFPNREIHEIEYYFSPITKEQEEKMIDYRVIRFTITLVPVRSEDTRFSENVFTITLNLLGDGGEWHLWSVVIPINTSQQMLFVNEDRKIFTDTFLISG